VFDGPSPPFISQTLRDGTPQVQMKIWIYFGNHRYLISTLSWKIRSLLMLQQLAHIVSSRF